MRLHEGRPVVTATGAVELWHRACWDARDQVTAIAVEPAAPLPPARRNWLRRALVLPAVAAVVVAPWSWRELHAAPTATIANVELATESIVARQLATTRERVPAPTMWVETELEARYQVPLHAGLPLDVVFPSLRGWIHPVTRSPELMPEQASRHFGAQRIGIERAECGAGHCGVDLDGPRGRPVVAVAAGTIVRVERHELGLDGRSGRYVRIEHDDGTLTAYMHLDDVVDELEVGTHVEAGQVLGTLGATAVYTAPPHLHFSLEVPNHPGRHGDNLDTHYVDPAPFLVRASITPGPERHRHALKPAS